MPTMSVAEQRDSSFDWEKSHVSETEMLAAGSSVAHSGTAAAAAGAAGEVSSHVLSDEQVRQDLLQWILLTCGKRTCQMISSLFGYAEERGASGSQWTECLLHGQCGHWQEFPAQQVNICNAPLSSGAHVLARLGCTCTRSCKLQTAVDCGLHLPSPSRH